MIVGSPDVIGTTWWKTDGTDHFKVQDILLDGSEMIITTTDGRQIRGSKLSQYIQSETPIVKPPKQPNTPKINKAALLQGLSSEELGDIMVHDNIPAEPLLKSQQAKPSGTTSEEDVILSRFFKNFDSSCIEIKCNITDEFKEKLKGISVGFDISIEKIAEFICKNQIDNLTDSIQNTIKSELCQNSNQ